MATTTKGRSPDRKMIAGEQDHEVRHQANKADVPRAEVKAAVKAAGNSRKKVERQLGAKA